MLTSQLAYINTGSSIKKDLGVFARVESICSSKALVTACIKCYQMSVSCHSQFTFTFHAQKDYFVYFCLRYTMLLNICPHLTLLSFSAKVSFRIHSHEEIGK